MSTPHEHTEHDAAQAHGAHSSHAPHEAHAGSGSHNSHAGHDKHAGHDPEAFRRLFSLSLSTIIVAANAQLLRRIDLRSGFEAQADSRPGERVTFLGP